MQNRYSASHVKNTNLQWLQGHIISKAQTSMNTDIYTQLLLTLLFLLARLMGQYCIARCRLLSVVVCNTAGGRAGRPSGARAVRRPTLHGGPVVLRSVTSRWVLVFTVQWTVSQKFTVNSSTRFWVHNPVMRQISRPINQRTNRGKS